MEKKQYEAPQVQVIQMSDDVITSSIDEGQGEDKD